MYSKTNKSNFRKRKLEQLEADLIFELEEGDCSPASSPEHKQINDEETKQQDLIDAALGQNSNPKMDDVKNVDIIEYKQVNNDTNVINFIKEESSNHKVIVKEEIQLRLDENIASENVIESNDKFLFSIKFRDKTFADINKDKIIEAIVSSLRRDIRVESDEFGLKIKFWEGKTASDMEITDESDDGLYIDDTKDVEDLFTVDTTPSSNKCFNGEPKFYSRTKYTIEDKNVDITEVPGGSKVRCNQSVCFNCDGPHALKDCKEPRNYRKINMARNKHKEMKSAKNTRYHLEEEQKYGHLKAGQLSVWLREALGLDENDMPSHVYHMRRVGYPPGWLEAARPTHSSSLAIYDADGQEESGETQNTGSTTAIDPDKVVVYPGFNAPCPEGARDLHAEYGCPPYSERHDARHMLAHLIGATSGTPQKARLTGSPAPTRRCDSPSLTDLERQKQQLLDMLNNGVKVPAEGEAARIVSLEQLECTPEPSVVKCSSYGTPLLKTLSPYERIPRPENFSVGVSPVINFENLPDSTGKYQQMTTVLSKVRSTIRTNLTDKLDAADT